MKFIFAFFTSLTLSLIFTPPAKKIAIKFNIIDVPDTAVKTHKKSIPYLGGGAIALSLLITLLIMSLLFNLEFVRELSGILVGSFIILLLGFIDDIKNINPYIKLGFQALASMIVLLFGLEISFTGINVIDHLLALIWMITITNAFNLIDIMDGLSAGVAIFTALTLFTLFIQINEVMTSLLLITLAGACLGFVKYNFNPAQIFMGDTGSLFLGFFLSCTSLQFLAMNSKSHSFIMIIVVFTIPLFETIFISLLRIKRGQSPLKGSKDHFALRMIKYGFTVRRTVLITYIFAFSLGLISIILFHFEGITIWIFLILLIIAIFLSIKLGSIDMKVP